MSMEITFNSHLAKILGVSCAVTLNFIINQTRLLGQQEEDGNIYLDLSLSDISRSLDFYNERTIRRAFDTLKSKGCIGIKNRHSGKYICVHYDVIYDLLNDNMSY